MTLKRPEPDTSHSGVFGEKQWKLVPLLPTQEMIDAWRLDQAQLRSLETSYKAMIDAAPPAPDPRDEIIRELRDKFAETGKRLRYLSDFCPNEEMDGNLEALARRCEDIANAELRDILAEALSKAKGVVDG